MPKGSKPRQLPGEACSYLFVNTFEFLIYVIALVFKVGC